MAIGLLLSARGSCSVHKTRPQKKREQRKQRQATDDAAKRAWRANETEERKQLLARLAEMRPPFIPKSSENSCGLFWQNNFCFTQESWPFGSDLDAPDGSSSRWTRLWTVTYAEDSPTEVRQLQMTRRFSRQASFTWLPPATPNGRIRDYRVAYRPLRLVLPCSPIEQTENKLIVPMSSQCVNLEELRPYTVYVISVHAVTVKPGSEFTINFTTEQAVPEGTPTALNYSKGTGDEYVIFWGPVPCEIANGVVRRYYLELDSADPWDSRLRTTRVALESLPSSTSPRHLPVRHFPLND
ncbi:hypothetical protein HPB47_028301 [Ixodes persulcatus]|uniref:Uncharacterized protein n=1 Tax=Ixodes persulcatus TaxID=34615 RepID=A0AC60PTN5_IXOPE|nr:hypothetical protein HPB47_028301 [Ixodes persulcatus]